MKDYAWVKIADELSEAHIRQHFPEDKYPDIRGLFYSQSLWANQQCAEYDIWYKGADDEEELPTGLYYIPTKGIIHNGTAPAA